VAVVTTTTDGVVEAWAPGRATVMGDHTDYNFGLALAVATQAGTRVRASPSERWILTSSARDLPTGWESVPQACIAALRDEGAQIPPARVEIDGDLPVGRGLSSSTSLTAATLTALALLSRAPLEPDHVADLSRAVENDYLGIPSGSLDQEVVVRAENGVVQFIDFASGRRESAALRAPEGHRLVAVDTGQQRRLGPENIGRRRRECASAARRVTGAADAAAWRQIQEMPAAEISSRVSSPTDLGRLAHVRGENDRVRVLLDRGASIGAAELADLMNASHASLRDLFEVSTEVVERRRDELLQTEGVLAARLVGAGFGGCLLVLTGDGVPLPPGSVPLATPVEAHRAHR
jgi:galactokinase